MRRREFFQSLLAAPLATNDEHVCALLLDVSSRRVLAVSNPELARRCVAPPGSAIKPLSLLALLSSGKLNLGEQYVCPGQLNVSGRVLNCSHPIVPEPMDLARTIAYSCNCAVAHFAERFAPGELGRFLERMGLSSLSNLLGNGEASGHVSANTHGSFAQLQALGYEGVEVTPLELLSAYRRMALRAHDELLQPILEGLEQSVEIGMGQKARLPRVRVAGKTGSVNTSRGLHAAWFAGFAPSRRPEVAVTVLTQGASGGADAAPVAADLLRRYFGARS